MIRPIDTLALRDIQCTASDQLVDHEQQREIEAYIDALLRGAARLNLWPVEVRSPLIWSAHNLVVMRDRYRQAGWTVEKSEKPQVLFTLDRGIPGSETSAQRAKVSP